MSNLTANSSSTNILEFKQPAPRGYFKLRHAVLGSTNYRSLTTDEIAIFNEIAGKYRGNNNGEIPFSIEDAKQRFRIGYPKAAAAFDALEEHGFGIRTQRGQFDFKTKAERETRWALSDWILGSQIAPKAAEVGYWIAPNTSTLGPAAAPNRLLDKERKKDLSFFLSTESGLPSEAQEGQQSGPSAPSDSPPSSSPLAKAIPDVPRAAGQARADNATWIDYEGPDSWKWAWVRRLGPLATGKTYVQATRSPGFPLPIAEWEAIKATALKNPSLVTNGGGGR